MAERKSFFSAPFPCLPDGGFVLGPVRTGNMGPAQYFGFDEGIIRCSLSAQGRLSEYCKRRPACGLSTRASGATASGFGGLGAPSTQSTFEHAGTGKAFCLLPDGPLPKGSYSVRVSMYDRFLCAV